MKTINKIFRSLLIVLFSAGCSGLLDDVTPDTSIPEPEITDRKSVV